jgi:two-component system chemotaxis sensor kinase CheA
MNEVVREFLLEMHDNLAQLDLDLVRLEKEPSDRDTLSRVFRTLHTVKGTSGFLGLPKLQAVAHAAENLLSKLRSGELSYNTEIASALLGSVDAIRKLLDSLEKSEGKAEGPANFITLIQTLERLTGGTAHPSRSVTMVTQGPPTPPPEVSTAPTRLTHQTPPPPPTVPAPPPLPAVAPEPDGRATAAVSDSAIRVDVGLLDKLMNLVGELVLARNQILQFSTSQEDDAFLGTVQRLNLLTTEIQAGVMKTRMQPIGNLWSKFPRIVRDLAVACGKQVRLEMDGQETELDKTIVESIRDPLTHLVRNAIDHGIETPERRAAADKPPEGRLRLHAAHEGGKVIIEMSDDGGGIDPERVRHKAVASQLVPADKAARLGERELLDLIFLPGFSTTDSVTQFSGRGVGMDVVRTNIEKIGGTVDLTSTVGRGTTIKMKIPLTLAIIPALTITCGGDRYAIPQVSLLELVRLEGDAAIKGIEQIHGAAVYRLRGNLLPLVYLSRQLNVETAQSPSSEAEVINIVVVQADDRPFGLIVDAIHDTEEIVVKPLQKQLKGLGVYAGATIMGDGKVALILDVLGLAQKSGVVAQVRERALADRPVEKTEVQGDRRTLLLVETAGGGRLAIPLAQVARLEEFPRSSLERAGPQTVVQYRDEILPLIDVARALRPGKSGRVRARPQAEGSVQVVVYADRGIRVGLVVGRITDIVEETITSRGRATRPGVQFTAVVQGRVTEFLDVEGLLRRADPELFSHARAGGA